jgi:hypothetical protein
MKIRIVTLDKNARIWDIKEVIPAFTRTGKLNAATQRHFRDAIQNMDSNFLYTVDKIEIYRIED